MTAALTAALVITGLGILNTIYLSYHAIRGTSVWCLGFPDEWCKKVQYSEYSKTFGIKNPYLGFGMLSVILVLLILGFKETVPMWPAKGLIVFGFLFSMYFLYIQAFKIKAFCTWCVVSALVFTGLFITQFFF
jgi:uncharacterized membrane protein